MQPSIQIIKFRQISGHKKAIPMDTSIRLECVEDVFTKTEDILKMLPIEERYNIFFTVSHCVEGVRLRNPAYATVIPFDIDKITVGQEEQVFHLACEALGVPNDKVAATFSGHGIQFFIRLDKAISEKKYYQENKGLYKYLCDKINARLMDAGVAGECDTSVFDMARVMRVPGTINKKPSLPDVESRIIQPVLEPINFDLQERVGGEVGSSKGATIARLALSFNADEDGVLKGCDFLKWCKDNQESVEEPQWYAMLSILRWLPGGERLIHEYSERHPSYSAGETTQKAEQAYVSAGPRTCANVESMWDGCRGCRHYRKHTSPITIQGEDFIETKQTGFYYTNMDGKKTKPNYNDLLKYFKKKHTYISIAESELIYVYRDEKWEPMQELELKSFCEKAMDPAPEGDHIRTEFIRKLQANNVRKMEWFNKTTESKINLQNGVYDLKTQELLPHSSEYGFLTKLPYAYDAEAKAERFDRFLDEITCGDRELRRLIMQFLGYAISNSDVTHHKSLMLYGDGRNGKSVLSETVQKLVGYDNCSQLFVRDLGNDQKTVLLEGKYFNISEESDVTDFARSGLFKNLVAGGAITVKKLYSQPYTIRNRAKFIVLCNQIPEIRDTTSGMMERLIIVPFNAQFIGTKADIFLKDKLEKELPGIFNMCMDGYRDLLEEGRFAVPKVCEDLLSEVREDGNIIDTWIRENIQSAPGSKERFRFANLHKGLALFCKDVGERRVPSRQAMTAAMKKAGFIKQKDRTSWYFDQIKVLGVDTD